MRKILKKLDFLLEFPNVYLHKVEVSINKFIFNNSQGIRPNQINIDAHVNDKTSYVAHNPNTSSNPTAHVWPTSDPIPLPTPTTPHEFSPEPACHTTGLNPLFDFMLKHFYHFTPLIMSP